MGNRSQGLLSRPDLIMAILGFAICVPSRSVNVLICATLWNVARQAPLSTGIFWQEYWSGLPFSFSRWSFWPRDWTHVSCVFCIAGRFFTHWAIRLCYIFINSFINQVIRVWVQKRFRNSVQGRIRHHRSFWSTALLNSASPSPGTSLTKGQYKKHKRSNPGSLLTAFFSECLVFLGIWSMPVPQTHGDTHMCVLSCVWLWVIPWTVAP